MISTWKNSSWKPCGQFYLLIYKKSIIYFENLAKYLMSKNNYWLLLRSMPFFFLHTYIYIQIYLNIHFHVNVYMSAAVFVSIRRWTCLYREVNTSLDFVAVIGVRVSNLLADFQDAPVISIIDRKTGGIRSSHSEKVVFLLTCKTRSICWL